MSCFPVVLLTVLVGGCAAAPQKWEGGALINPELIARELSPELLDERDVLPPIFIPPPTSLRPCCAFGSGLGVSVQGVLLPGVKLANTIGIEDLGLHVYDNGAIAFEQSRAGASPVNYEGNGLVYTCRGGFIDTAHLRDWSDLTLYLAARIEHMMDTGGTIDLADEAGTRQIVMQPVQASLIRDYGRKRLAVPLAQWVAFQLSIWHEIATWYGWAATMFSEQASSFSPEDLYSNLLGIKLAGVLIYDNAVGSEVIYNESMNVAIPRLLMRLGAVSGEVAKVAAESVDGRWWDSKIALPEANMVMRRNFSTGPKLTPWLVTQATPTRDAAPTVVERCGPKPRPIPLRMPVPVGRVPFAKRATIEITVSEEIAKRMALPRPGTRLITQQDFPKLTAAIHSEAQERFGKNFDQP